MIALDYEPNPPPSCPTTPPAAHAAAPMQVREAFALRPGALDLLVRAAGCRMPEARTNAVRALAGLACNNEQVANLVCAHEACVGTMLGICLEQGAAPDVNEVCAAAARVLVNVVDATLRGRGAICDKADALRAVANMVTFGTPAAKVPRPCPLPPPSWSDCTRFLLLSSVLGVCVCVCLWF